MKTKTFAILLLTLLIATFAQAQPIVTKGGTKSDELNLKIHKLDLLMKILPIAMNKDQYKDLLIAMSKARQKQKVLLEEEDDALAKLDATISDTLDAALNKGSYPSHEVQTQIARSSQDSTIKRGILTSAIVNQLVADITKSFNAGQIKVMAGSFDDRYIDPNAKKGDLKDDFKVKFFIQEVFLDPYSFDLIAKLENLVPADTTKKDGG